MKFRPIIATTGIVAGLTIAACGPTTQVASAKCATNPATGHVFGVVSGADCGHGPGHYYVDVECGPLTIATDDTCVKAHIVGDGTSTGIRGAVIVPNWYVNPAAGDTVEGTVE